MNAFPRNGSVIKNPTDSVAVIVAVNGKPPLGILLPIAIGAVHVPYEKPGQKKFESETHWKK